MRSESQTAFRSLLAVERDASLAAIAVLEAEHVAIVEGSAQANLDDEHDPEGATVGFERARVASLLVAARRRLAMVDGATERLEAGGYGACGCCGGAIAAERLEAHPAADCVRCAAVPSPPGPRRRGGGWRE